VHGQAHLYNVYEEDCTKFSQQSQHTPEADSLKHPYTEGNTVDESRNTKVNNSKNERLSINIT
jgi:hypothetical protein